LPPGLLDKPVLKAGLRPGALFVQLASCFQSLSTPHRKAKKKGSECVFLFFKPKYTFKAGSSDVTSAVP
jgi:hypothetical protein